jgi:hypothetical protein
MSLANRFAGLSQGFTDNKPVFLAKEAARRIASAFNSYKRKTRVFKQLFYTNNTFEEVRFLRFGATGPFSGLTMGHLTTDITFAKVDPATVISYFGLRMLPTLGFLSSPYYYETFNIVTPEGSLAAVSTYADSGLGSATTIPFQKFLVTNGDGIFAYCSSVVIEYDNDGTKLGVAGGRRMTFYEYYS